MSSRPHQQLTFLPPLQSSPQAPDKSAWPWGPGRPLNLYLYVKVLSYISIGLVTVELAPYTFHIMGI